MANRQPIMHPRLVILTSLSRGEVDYGGVIRTKSTVMSNGRTYTHPAFNHHPVGTKFAVLFAENGILGVGVIRQVVKID